jgi:hypothetical protein
MIVEPQHTVASRYQECIASRITMRVLELEMLPTVDFDDEPGRMTHKVDDKWSDRRLTPKTCPG